MLIIFYAQFQAIIASFCQEMQLYAILCSFMHYQMPHNLKICTIAWAHVKGDISPNAYSSTFSHSVPRYSSLPVTI